MATAHEETKQLVKPTTLVLKKDKETKAWTRYHSVAACLAVASVVAVAHTMSAATTRSTTTLDAPVIETSTMSMASQCPPRIRKSWDRWGPSDKALYIRALQTAMDRGLYQRFVEIHGEAVNNKEAHGSSCVFLLWHRKYLIGFENMLRSLAPEFACITLPFYDYVQHSVNRLTSKCVTMEDCSPILREMGGSQGSPTQAVVGGRAFTNCVNKAPADHSCEIPGKRCLRCIPRGPWSTTTFPNMGYALMKKSILDSADFLMASKNIEMNPHNMMHNALKGVMMDAYISPTEPVFYSHHNTIDLLHAIYHKCKVTPLKLQGEALWNDPRNFKGCVQPPKDPNGRVITSQTDVTMRSLYKGKPIPVDEDPELKQYFVGLPKRYSQFTDTLALGSNSYSYEIPGLLGDLFTRCEKSDMQFAGLAQIWMEQLHMNKKAPEPTPTKKKVEPVVVPIHKPENIHYMSWRHEIAILCKEQNLTIAQTDSDMAKIVVHIYDKYLPGEVKDYSPAFKKMWRIEDESLSRKILDGMEDGTHPIRVKGWEEITQRYFGDTLCGDCKNCRYFKGEIQACYQGWTSDQCSNAGRDFIWCGDKPLPTNDTCGTCNNCYYGPTDACYEGWNQKQCTSLGYEWCGQPSDRR